jgi:hypothetical protein
MFDYRTIKLVEIGEDCVTIDFRAPCWYRVRGTIRGQVFGEIESGGAPDEEKRVRKYAAKLVTAIREGQRGRGPLASRQP